MENLERKLHNLTLPQQSDTQHQYELRRALLNCSYFCEDSKVKIFSDRVKYYLTSKHLVATVTIGMVVVVGTISNMAMGQWHANENVVADDALDISQSLVAAPPTVSSSESEAVVVATSSQKEVLENVSEELREVRILSFDEISQLLQQAYAMNSGTIMIKLDSGMYMYSFSPPLEQEYVPSTFGVASYTAAQSSAGNGQ